MKRHFLLTSTAKAWSLTISRIWRNGALINVTTVRILKLADKIKNDYNVPLRFMLLEKLLRSSPDYKYWKTKKDANVSQI